MNLNIGCGKDPWGDVRLDVSKHYRVRSNLPTIIADAQNLPFKEVFNEVHSFHVLEELPDCVKGLKEAVRVCKKTLVLRFPIDDGFERSAILGLIYLLTRLSPYQLLDAIECRKNTVIIG